jgi:succinyl-CoA synthetase beta subunit
MNAMGANVDCAGARALAQHYQSAMAAGRPNLEGGKDGHPRISGQGNTAKRFGVAVPDGALAYSPEQAAYRARELGGDKWIVKAQVHAGGAARRAASSCASEHEIQDATNDMFGRKLVTHQTGPEGKGIYRVYVESAQAFDREIYLGFVLDRTSQRVMIVASSEGGMEIEEISANRPESIVRSTVEPAVGLQEFQAREIAYALGIPDGTDPADGPHPARLLPRLPRP